MKRYGYYHKDIETTIEQITDNALKTQKSKDWEQYLNNYIKNNNTSTNNMQPTQTSFKSQSVQQANTKNDIIPTTSAILTAEKK